MGKGIETGSLKFTMRLRITSYFCLPKHHVTKGCCHHRSHIQAGCCHAQLRVYLWDLEITCMARTKLSIGWDFVIYQWL